VVPTVLSPAAETTSPSGNYSFAGGRNAHALHDGNFIWADSLPHVFDLIGIDNVFAVRATGGAFFVSSVAENGDPLSGVLLGSGGSSWSSVSDRNAKMASTEVDPSRVLESLMQMPISEYSYKSQDESIRHMGPMAQDFHPLFGLGEDELMISAMNLAGVALAAIQGLNAELDSSVNRVSVLEADRIELAKRVAALEAENAELRQLAGRNNALEARLAALEALLVEDRQVAGQQQ
jgi:trimeric autotransporter adhesin